MEREKLIEITINSLKNNNMEAVYLKDVKKIKPFLDDYILPGSTVSFGGSVTLKETGIYDHLKNWEADHKIRLLDRDLEGVDKEAIARESFYSDYYLTGSNAVTKNGYLYNVDGNGNRVAAMIFGPKKVIVVVGVNKLVETKEQAEERIRNISAPKNAQRLNLDTPCAVSAKCSDCKSDDRICCTYTFLGRQRTKDRIMVVILGDSFGY